MDFSKKQTKVIVDLKIIKKPTTKFKILFKKKKELTIILITTPIFPKHFHFFVFCMKQDIIK